MARSLTSGMSSALDADLVRPVLLVEANLDGEDVYLWSGIGDLSWNGNTWLGAGAIMSIGEVEEKSELTATGTNIVISGIPSEYISMALQNDYQGRFVYIRLATMDSSNNIIADPTIVFSGRIDVMTINESADSATVSLSIENRLIDFERPRVRRYTDQDQKIDYPNDQGLESVAAIQNKEITWGKTGG